MRKLSDDERPLLLRLCAGPSEKVLSLVLKENETGDVNVGFPSILVSHLVLNCTRSQMPKCKNLSVYSGMLLVFPSCATSCES